MARQLSTFPVHLGLGASAVAEPEFTGPEFYQGYTSRHQADGAEARLYEVVIDEENGGKTIITPFALGDLGDGDNNHKLCLDRPETIRSVRFPAGHLTDPRDDLNPDTSVNIAQQNVEPLRNPKGAAMSGRDESN